MINKIIEMLLLSDFYGESENIDIAKGKYKFTTSIKEQWKQAQRKRLIEKKLNNNGWKKSNWNWSKDTGCR